MFTFLSEDNLPRFLVMLALAAVLGYVAALVPGRKLPLGALGSIGFGLLGAWVAADLVRPRIPFRLPEEPQLDGVMLVTAGLGAFLFSLAWCLLLARFTRRSHRRF